MHILTKSHITRADKRNIVVYDPKAKGKLTKQLIHNMLKVQLDSSKPPSEIVTIFVNKDGMNRIKTWRTFGGMDKVHFILDHGLEPDGILVGHLYKRNSLNCLPNGGKNLVVGMTEHGQMLLGSF